MSQEKIVSIIVAYNSTMDIEVLLSNLLNETIVCYKTLIIDNSNEKLQKDIEEICNKEKFKLLNIKHIKMQENVGSAKGFSIGMSMAYDYGADWVWLHDQDGYPSSCCLANLLNGRSKDEPIIITPIVKDFEDVLVENFRCKNNVFYNATGIIIKENVTEIDCAGTAGILVSRSMIELIGNYDGENYFVGWEDFDYCYRARNANAKIIAIKDAVYFHPNLDKKYHRNHSDLKMLIRKKLQFCIPPFLGALGEKSNYRDQKAIYSYMYLLKKYTPPIIFYFNLAYAICRVSIMGLFLKKIQIVKTLKVYKNNLKIIKTINN